MFFALKCVLCAAVLLSVSTAIAYSQMPDPAANQAVRTRDSAAIGSASPKASLEELKGSVIDPSGAIVANCPVKIEDLGSGSSRQLNSAADGTFAVHVPRGKVKIAVGCESFNPQTRTVTVVPGIRPVIFRLQIAPVNETVEVATSSLGVALDQTDTQEAETLSSDTIAVLPVLDQDYVTFMSRFLDPSVTGNQGATLVVNGVEGGNLYQAPSAIKQLQVNQEQYSPAYATAGRARLSLITSSGTKTLHGSFSFALREHAWDATPDFSPIKPPEDREDYQGALTGPVRFAAHWQYAISAQLKKDEQYAVIHAETTSGPDVAPFPIPYYRDKVSGALFFDNGAGQQFTAAIGRTDEVHHNSPVGGLNLPSAAGDSEYTGHFLDLQLTTLFSAHTLNQARVAAGQEGLALRDDATGPQIQVAGAFNGGSEQWNHSYRQWTLSGNDLLANSRKADTLRVGLDIPELSVHTDSDETNREGTYFYPSLQAYQNGQPDLFTITAGTAPCAS